VIDHGRPGVGLFEIVEALHHPRHVVVPDAAALRPRGVVAVTAAPRAASV
jgi:hypothetical protein